MKNALLPLLLVAALSACAEPPKRAASMPVVAAPATSVPLLEARPGLLTAGQPAASDWAPIAARGVTTVINLRPSDEMQGRDEAAEVRAAGMRYIEIPVAGGSAVNAENARRLHEALQSTEGKVLLHCASANRAGGLLALTAVRHEGMAEAAALELGRRAGMKSTEAAVRTALATRCDADTAHC